MIGRFLIKLFESERAALVRLAEMERRDPRDQAAILLREALEHRGLLPPPTGTAVNHEESQKAGAASPQGRADF